MKNNFFTLATTSLMMGLMVTSCQTSSEKVEDAKADVQTAQNNLDHTVNDSAKEASQIHNKEQWNAFKSASIAKIDANKLRIDELKRELNKRGKTTNEVTEMKIDSLESRNKDLEKRMTAFNPGQSNWEAFQIEYNRDMDGLGDALKKFTVNSRKQ